MQWAYEHSELSSKLLRSVVYTKRFSGVRSNPRFCETPRGRYTARAALLPQGAVASCRRRREASDLLTSTAVTHPPSQRQQRGGGIWVAAQLVFDNSFLCTLLKMFQGVALSFQGVAVKHRPRGATLTRRALYAVRADGQKYLCKRLG